MVTQWLPVIIWVTLLYVLSTRGFSAANTAALIEPLLRWLWPSASGATIGLVHGLIRKAAHFTNYAILFWLLYRGPMRRRPMIALLLCVLYAITDESHQILVPGRTPSPFDVILDSSGAMFSRFFLMARESLRER